LKTVGVEVVAALMAEGIATNAALHQGVNL
jgi:hypothetical protein